MLNSIREYRKALDGIYSLTLEIPEKEYEEIYGDISTTSAYDILSQYFDYRQEDGRPDNVEIKHDKGRHIVLITADLIYTGNDHTMQSSRPDYIRKEDEEIL